MILKDSFVMASSLLEGLFSDVLHPTKIHLKSQNKEINPTRHSIYGIILPTFALFLWYMQANIPYIQCVGMVKTCQISGKAATNAGAILAF